MEKQTIDRRTISHFGNLSNQITYHQERLTNYLQDVVELDSFEQQIQRKRKVYSSENRRVLSEALTEQLSPYFSYEKVQRNVELLKKENTFTITAGHQLNLFGGPLYTLYKIFDAIKLAELLKNKYPTENFVPVFWMATEDHDFEEINHLHLFGDTLSWETQQTGPVGRFSLDGIENFKSSLLEKFQNNQDFSDYLNRFYKSGDLASATTEFLMDLVGEYGIVIIDADRKNLKSLFSPLVKKELETQFSEKEIATTTASLETDGFHGQAFARPINLFYIKDQLRERIIPLGNDEFEIAGENWNKKQLFLELENHPERFSPNVVLRPLYQETILPNLCYLGGGGEMAYWLQLKGMFTQAEVPFPLLKVRNSIQWIDKITSKRIQKLGLKYTDIFSSIDEVKKQFVFENAEEELDFTDLDKAEDQLLKVLERSVAAIDSGLSGYAKSEAIKIEKQLAQIRQRLIRQQKKKHEDAMGQIDGIYEKMFPENGLQERYDNVIPFLSKFGAKEYVKQIYNAVHPLEKDLILVIEE
ncbi:MAG TPA: bacillithiol biosynthesis cysteine-adding enzyme BshC [Brumimicrobium sp.]|nr:bacillithiol biosynthesis cysteine-adding enzyme BshC [Brumimicrobium sp.]